MKIITTSICLITSCAGLFFLGATTLPGETQPGPSAHPSPPAKRRKATTPTWHTGPASSPPVTEFIPSHPPPVPPPMSTLRDSYAKRNMLAGASSPAVPAAPAARGMIGNPAAAVEPVATASPDPPDTSNSPDPEAQRIQAEFARLREDTGARRAFYEDLLNTVERVRAGGRNDSSAEEKLIPSPPAAFPSRETSQEPVIPPHLPEIIEPPGPPPEKPLAPHSSLGPNRDRIDGVAYQRVVHWAKANGAPVSLALGVAWMESHLNSNPPRGSAGEVGMFQIVPERCRLEGWPSQRLSEPEFNAWMGTMLLARYYQEEGSVARAAAKYVAGPGVFNKKYSKDMWAYIDWYTNTVDTYASYFSRDQI